MLNCTFNLCIQVMISSKKPGRKFLSNSKHVMQNQHLSIYLRTSPNTNYWDFKAGGYFTSQFGRYFLKNESKTACVFKKMCILDKLFSFLIIFSSHHVGSKFMDRLWCQPKMAHNRNSRAENTGNRFNYLAPSFYFDTVGPGFFHYP